MPAGIHRIDVITTKDLLDAAQPIAKTADLVIMAAAPADYRVAKPLDGKYKKSSGTPVLELIDNPDVLQSLVTDRRQNQVIVGFAAEVGDPVPEAIRKCAKKGCDFVAGNNVSNQHGAFGSDTTELVLCNGQSVVRHITPATKIIAAQQLLNFLANELVARRPAAS